MCSIPTLPVVRAKERPAMKVASDIYREVITQCSTKTATGDVIIPISTAEVSRARG